MKRTDLTLVAGALVGASLVACKAAPEAPAPRRIVIEAAHAPEPIPSPGYDKPGFTTRMVDGRLWVFDAGTPAVPTEKSFTVVNGAPGGLTVRAVDERTAKAYIASRSGFDTQVEGDSIWVWRQGDERVRPASAAELSEAGPQRMTVRAVDEPTARAYLLAKRGFEVELVDGRLHVWRAGQRDDAEMTAMLVQAGLGTVKAPDSRTALAYVATRPGFEVEVDSEAESIWVWRQGDPHDRPADHATREGAGPFGKTLVAADPSILTAYLEER